MIRRIAIAAAACLALLATAQPRPEPAAAARPRLLAFISVDQMRSDYLDRYAKLYKAGLRRILDQGAFFANARYRHANNETGPGHSVLLSGRDPRSSGIVSNDWYDSTLRRVINVVEDPAQQTLGGSGRAASPANFLGFTLGDALKHVSPDSRVVGAAGKDRSAVLMAGRRADAAYWFVQADGRYVTSTYYARTLPEWLAAWNAKQMAAELTARSWSRLLPDVGLYERLAGPDAVASELDGKEIAFPHKGGPLGRTPFGDELTLDVALQAMESHGLGKDAVTDVLVIGFSSTDGVGHAYGADSQEQMDNLLRLDVTLGRLFDALDARVGKGNWLFGMSADHGSMPLVETLQAQGKDAQRATPRAIAAAVDAALEARFPGVTGLVAHRDGADVYLDLPAVARAGLQRPAVEAAVAAGLMATGHVERVYTHAHMLSDAPQDDPLFELHKAAFFAPRSPHLMTRLKPYRYLSTYPGGTGHGSAHDYDRHVPVVFMGPGIKPGRYTGEAGPEDIAPTLAALLGLEFPIQDAKRVLSEMFARGAAAASGAPGSTR